MRLRHFPRLPKGHIALNVTPQIDESDGITLHLHPSVSVVAEKQKNVNLGSLGNFQLPLAVNESDSVIRVQDGAIVAIGGLMKQQQANNSPVFRVPRMCLWPGRCSVRETAAGPRASW